LKLDIIIPTLNEESNIKLLLRQLLPLPSDELVNITIVDGSNSSDNTETVCNEYGVRYLKCSSTRRSTQMNLGARDSKADVFLFLHADVIPPEDYYSLIKSAYNHNYKSGCFAYQFDSDRVMLRFNSYFSQYKGFFTGGGDQCLFICRKCFEALGGFCDSHVLMEDFELYKKVKSHNINYKIIKSRASVSARKYDNNSWLKVNMVNLISLIRYKLDHDTESIRSSYRRWLSPK